ncbi:MAG TPA: hypothetical protein VE270_01480 [Thermoleophilaceae bacterium]|nr:hypothetical protein [Thermoleophilaceae bacterium]
MAEPVPRRRRLREKIESQFVERLSPERTRRSTLFERYTVGRLDWDTVARLNRWLELLGRIATAVWVCLIATIVLGLDVKNVVEDVINSGEPLREVLILALIIPTLAFFLLHSTIGFLRWRLQRELWRRNVERLEGGIAAEPELSGEK